MPNKGKRSGRKSKSREELLKKYRNENRAVENKIRKLKKHCKKLPNDEQSKKVLETYLK